MATSGVVPKLFTVRQVAEVTGLQRFRIYQLIREKRLPAIRIGATFRVSEAALTEWIMRASQSGGGR